MFFLKLTQASRFMVKTVHLAQENSVLLIFPVFIVMKRKKPLKYSKQLFISPSNGNLFRKKMIQIHYSFSKL